jgi:hypothetical protein
MDKIKNPYFHFSDYETDKNGVNVEQERHLAFEVARKQFDIQLASLNPEMKPVDISEMYLDRDKAEQFVFQYYWKQFDHNSIKSLAEYNKVIPLDGAGLVHSAHIKGRDDGIKAQLAADQLTRDKKREELEARNKELIDALKSIREWLMFPKEIKEDGVWNEQFVKANNLVNQALAQEKG